ncbi:multiubiquitin domain-containing protein [Klebsiella variicola]|uniref:multiubiquitin domain-containing protein n=1 Tax=Klebsiella variicola TaxID=244366 RepID=UPI0022474284|nr:multiubiquitin domain-containing protein [Klebsiella variicola]MCW9238083.1 multiubiquitin domain-containing protein [Klebsiella variicola]
MNTENTHSFDDVGEAIREGRELRSASAYRILFALENLTFRAIEVNDPVPLGRQILSASGLRANQDYSLFAIVETGDFEDLRLDEPFDLRGRGAERFVAFQTDRDFKLTVNDSQISWGKPVIPGSVLYELAKPGEGDAVFMVIRGGNDRQIEPSEAVDLTAPGVEHFVTAPKHKPKIDIAVNGREIQVTDSHQTFEQLVALAYPGEAPTPEIVYSITYRGVFSKPHSGELAAGGFIEVKNGSVINVSRTIQS